MPAYKTHKDWMGLRVVTHDADRHRRYLLRWRNYHILDTPKIRVDVTETKNTPQNINFDHIHFWQSAQKHTKMYCIKEVESEALENGRRYFVSGRQVKEREDYRIDIAYSEHTQSRYNSEVVFSAAILSWDITREKLSLAMWGGLIALALRWLVVGTW